MNRKLVKVEYANSTKHQPRHVYVAVEAPWLDVLIERCKEGGHAATIELEDMVALGVPQCSPGTPQFWLPHDWNAFASWLDGAHANDQQQVHEAPTQSDTGAECSGLGQFFTAAEREGLLKVLQELKRLGWQVTYLDDGEERTVYPAGAPLENVVYDANQVEDARIGLAGREIPGAARRASIYVVWGNSPIELIADWCGSSSFDEAIEAAQKAVWPNYPEE